MKRIQFNSLGFRVFFLSTFGTIVITVLATVLLSIFFRNTQKAGLDMKGQSMSELLAQIVVPFIDFEDDAAAAEVLKNAVSDKDVIYASAYKLDGSLFAQAGKGAPKKCKVLKKKTSVFAEHKTYAAVTSPIKGEGDKIIGMIQLGYSLQSIFDSQKQIRIASILGCILLTAIVAFYFVQSINRIVVSPMTQMSVFVKKIGDGDLSPFERPKEAKTSEMIMMYGALERTTEAFRGNVEAITQAANDFSGSADEILVSTTNMSTSANQQASSVRETQVTLEEVEKTGYMSEQSAKNIVAVSNESVKISKEGLDSVDQTVNQLHGIRTQVEDIVQNSEQLYKQLDEVGQIVTSIGGVTRRSHILSVNASIEASKAGEAGKGFAVVANEVRELAKESGVAAEQARTTLEIIKTAIKSVVTSVEEGRYRTEQGVESIERTGKVIRRLGDVLNKTADAAQQIAVNASQQVVGLRQTTLAVSEISNAAEQSQVTSEVLAERGRLLNDRAVELKELVSVFKTD